MNTVVLERRSIPVQLRYAIRRNGNVAALFVVCFGDLNKSVAELLACFDITHSG